MEYSTAQNRLHILNRSLQMLLFGLLMNLGLTIIGFLAFFQFFWLLINKKKFIDSRVSVWSLQMVWSSDTVYVSSQ
jgi:hypothetical protein